MNRGSGYEPQLVNSIRSQVVRAWISVQLSTYMSENFSLTLFSLFLDHFDYPDIEISEFHFHEIRTLTLMNHKRNEKAQTSVQAW